MKKVVSLNGNAVAIIHYDLGDYFLDADKMRFRSLYSKNQRSPDEINLCNELKQKRAKRRADIQKIDFHSLTPMNLTSFSSCITLQVDDYIKIQEEIDKLKTEVSEMSITLLELIDPDSLG